MGSPEDRPWEVGLLWSDEEESARLMIDYLQRRTPWAIGDNEPYDAREFNYTVTRHLSPRGLPHLTLEVRQDLLESDRAVLEMADMLADGVEEIAARRAPTSGP